MTWWCSATGQAWTWTWRTYPGVWLFIVGLALGFRALAWRSDPGSPTQPDTAGSRPTWPGAAGLLLIWLLLDWPVGTLGAGYLVSVHAVQFLFFSFVVPPLLYAGVRAPAWGRLEARWGKARILRAITHPLVAGIAFNAIAVVTHLPGVVDGLMRRQLGAFGLDLAWLFGGLLFWWPVLALFPERAGGIPAKILYLFVASIVHAAIGMWLLLSQFPVYGIYELAPPIGGRSAMADQAVAGGLMELLGGLMILTAIAVLFFSWASEEDDGPLTTPTATPPLG